MPEETYSIQRLTAERLDDMTNLHNTVYGRHLAPDFFKRKYNTTFTGVMYVGYLAYYNNEPAAFYGVIPCFINGGEKLILAAQSADTMTHPKHQGKGLFIKLALLTYQLCSDEGIWVLFGFPNQNSQPGFVNKLNWQVSTTMERFSIPIKTIPLKSITNRLPFLNKWYNSYVSYCLKPFLSSKKGISSTVIDEGFYGLHRDTDYLNYRAAYTNTFTIKLHTTTLWFKIGDGMIIGDIDLAADDMEHIMARLQKLARKLGLTKINFQTDNRTVLNMLLKNYGQAIPSFPVIIKNLGTDLQTEKMAFTFADIDIF